MRQPRSLPTSSSMRVVRTSASRTERFGIMPLGYHGFFERLRRPLAGSHSHADTQPAAKRSDDQNAQQRTCRRARNRENQDVGQPELDFHEFGVKRKMRSAKCEELLN